MKKFIKRALVKLPKLDVNHIRRLVADLAHEHDRLKVVLDSMNDGVLVGDRRNLLIFHNRAAKRLLPFAGSEAKHHLLWSAIDDRHIAQFVRESLLNQETIHDRHFTLDNQGPPRTLSCSIVPLVRDGHVEGNILRIADITAKQSREARLRRAETLASFTTLAASVAHEIKNPLGSIGIYVQLIRRAIQSKERGIRKQIEGHIDVVLEEIERLNKIVVDFLFAVRPIDLKPELRNPNRVLRELIEFVRHELEMHGIEIVAELSETVPDIQLDEQCLKQALLNMIKNAMESMPDGGQIGLHTDSTDEEVTISIADTGIGMSPEVQQHIFEPYWTSKDFGSGIGLTIAYKLIKEHHGEVIVHSQPGAGSRFVVTLPIPRAGHPLLGWDGVSA